MTTSQLPNRASDGIFQLIRADIVGARLKPGEKLNIGNLCEQYGVGATPMREALSRLSSQDLVIPEAQKGFRVAPVSQRNLLEVTKCRSWIEALALRESISKGDRAWESRIIATAHRLAGIRIVRGEPLGSEWYKVNRLFHDALVGACDVDYLMTMRRQLYDHGDRYRQLAANVDPAVRDLHREHQSLMEAVLSRDEKSAVKLVSEHFLETARAIVALERHEGAAIVISNLRREIYKGLGIDAA